jgi:hypothetical protein
MIDALKFNENKHFFLSWSEPRNKSWYWNWRIGLDFKNISWNERLNGQKNTFFSLIVIKYRTCKVLDLILVLNSLKCMLIPLATKCIKKHSYISFYEIFWNLNQTFSFNTNLYSYYYELLVMSVINFTGSIFYNNKAKKGVFLAIFEQALLKSECVPCRN